MSEELAKRKAELQSESYQAWLKARDANSWNMFAPKLQEHIQLARDIAAAVDPEKSAYDSNLDTFEKGITSERVQEVFTELKAGIIPLIAELKKGTKPDGTWMQGDWDVKKQSLLCNSILKDLGYDFEHGRVDVSVHPVTFGLHPDDARITTRYKKEDITEGITGAVHECGHAFYEQGRNPEYDGLPIGDALSMGVHESQSLLWERMVALSPAFCAYLLPKIQSAFPDFGKGKSPEVRLNTNRK
jgi:carboxypeptidase Taq